MGFTGERSWFLSSTWAFTHGTVERYWKVAADTLSNAPDPDSARGSELYSAIFQSGSFSYSGGEP